MGRHREFDEDAVLDAVLSLFWRQGYRGTSLRDLAQETGLAEARLYNAFGDKRQLFLLALTRYRTRGLRRLSKLEASDDPLAAVQDFVLSVARGLARQSDFRGCLITNTLIELSPHDAEVRKLLKASLDVRQTALTKALAAAQARGQLDARCDAATLARYLVQILEGLRVVAKTDPGEQTLVSTAEFALSLLPRSKRSARPAKPAAGREVKTKDH